MKIFSATTLIVAGYIIATLWEHRAKVAMIALLAVGASDAGAQPIRQQRMDDKFSVELRILPKDEVVNTCRSFGMWSHLTLDQVRRSDNVGCNVYYVDRKHCVIYAAMPRHMGDLIRFEVLGHELLHCAIGSYHD
jgi:hypothetical protein